MILADLTTIWTSSWDVVLKHLGFIVGIGWAIYLTRNNRRERKEEEDNVVTQEQLSKTTTDLHGRMSALEQRTMRNRELVIEEINAVYERMGDVAEKQEKALEASNATMLRNSEHLSQTVASIAKDFYTLSGAMEHLRAETRKH
jgi:mevalonate kinase